MVKICGRGRGQRGGKRCFQRLLGGDAYLANLTAAWKLYNCVTGCNSILVEPHLGQQATNNPVYSD